MPQKVIVLRIRLIWRQGLDSILVDFGVESFGADAEHGGAAGLIIAGMVESGFNEGSLGFVDGVADADV